ncbi:hypothetical protein MKEN_01310600 [Mycena kentingensis (nom. inval.)]|nr:hypothetical protein MKEN_01310600 [Mycena kentingensis (nom. inval.)]
MLNLVNCCRSPLYNPPGTDIALAAAYAAAISHRLLGAQIICAEDGSECDSDDAPAMGKRRRAEDGDESTETKRRKGEGSTSSSGVTEEGDGDADADTEATSARQAYPCTHCKKTFHRPSSLQTHMHTHTGALPFGCPHPGCGQAFNVKSNMRRHFRSAHPDSAFVDAPAPVQGSGAGKRAPRGRRRKAILASLKPSPESHISEADAPSSSAPALDLSPDALAFPDDLIGNLLFSAAPASEDWLSTHALPALDSYAPVPYGALYAAMPPDLEHWTGMGGSVGV